jgi:hypothetical protein
VGKTGEERKVHLPAAKGCSARLGSQLLQHDNRGRTRSLHRQTQDYGQQAMCWGWMEVVKMLTDAMDRLWVVPSPPGFWLSGRLIAWGRRATLRHRDRSRKRDNKRVGARVRQARGERERVGEMGRLEVVLRPWDDQTRAEGNLEWQCQACELQAQNTCGCLLMEPNNDSLTTARGIHSCDFCRPSRPTQQQSCTMTDAHAK